eukprot:scaffold348_cov329-Pavlova_lutheri.AAC.57
MDLRRRSWTWTRRGCGRPKLAALDLGLGVRLPRLRIVAQKQLLRLLVRRAILQLRNHRRLLLSKCLQVPHVPTLAPVRDRRRGGVHQPRQKRHHGERKQADGHLLQRVFAEFRFQHRPSPRCTRHQEQRAIAQAGTLPSPSKLLAFLHAFLIDVRKPRRSNDCHPPSQTRVGRTWRGALASARCSLSAFVLFRHLAHLQGTRFSIDPFQGTFVARVVGIGRPRYPSKARNESAHRACRAFAPTEMENDRAIEPFVRSFTVVNFVEVTTLGVGWEGGTKGAGNRHQGGGTGRPGMDSTRQREEWGGRKKD